MNLDPEFSWVMMVRNWDQDFLGADLGCAGSASRGAR